MENINIINTNNTTVDANAQGTVAIVNRIAEFYKMTEHAYDTFFADYRDNDAIVDMQKEIKRLGKVIEEKTKEYGDMLTKRYNGKFTPISHSSYLRYTAKTAGDCFFDFATGAEAYYDAANEDAIKYNAPTKTGNVSIVVGYCYELGAVVTRHYSYKINQACTYCNFKLLSESIVPMLEYNDIQTYYTESNQIYPGYRESAIDALGHLKAEEFLRVLYNISEDRDISSLNLKSVRNYMLQNKSFEIILKTAPVDMIEELAEMKVEKAMPIHKILNMDKVTYQKCVDKGLLSKFLKLKSVLKNCNQTTLETHLMKTDEEWLDLIEDNEHWEENFGFYGIDYNRSEGLLCDVVRYYLGVSSYSYRYECGERGSIICRYYKFGKFLNYIHDGAVDQGYTSVANFYTELRDYLRMCEQENSVPTLFSSYLSQTHNIMARNHKLKVDKEQEEIFKSRYEDFKNWESPDHKYSIIRPETTNDMKLEGDALNHCVASYIKRVIDGETMIVFLRLTENINESLVTVEIANKVIKQARGLHNRDITARERNALNTFANKRGYVVKV